MRSGNPVVAKISGKHYGPVVPEIKNDFIFPQPATTMFPKFLSRSFCLLCLGLSGPQALAGFSSIYVFGDGVSNTNVQPEGGGADYYGTRYCNGRVFVEVLAGWQGVTFDPAKNLSYFGHVSEELLANLATFPAPADAAQSLFIVWNNDADYVDAILSDISLPFGDLTPWNDLRTRSIADHLSAVATLYDKGARKIVMPLAVDVMSVPNFNAVGESDRAFARQRIVEYNAQFKTAISGLMASKPGLEIVMPDTFAFFDQVLADPGAFGLVDFEDENAGGLDSGDPALDGAGAQYVFWDDFHPTAKFQMHLAAFFQQIISPVKVNNLSLSGGNVQIQVANIPLGRDGVILGSANLQPPWAQDAAIDEDLLTTQTFVFPANGPRRFYRVAFPVVWTWP